MKYERNVILKHKFDISSSSRFINDEIIIAYTPFGGYRL